MGWHGVHSSWSSIITDYMHFLAIALADNMSLPIRKQILFCLTVEIEIIAMFPRILPLADTS